MQGYAQPPNTVSAYPLHQMKFYLVSERNVRNPISNQIIGRSPGKTWYRSKINVDEIHAGPKHS